MCTKTSLMQLGAKVILTTKYEHPLDSLQQRIHNWLRGDACKDIFVLSAETIDIYAKDIDDRLLEKVSEECFQCYRLGSMNTYTFGAIRIFYCVLPDLEQTFGGSDRATSLTSIPPNQLTCTTASAVVTKQRKQNNGNTGGGGGVSGCQQTNKSRKLKKQSTLSEIPTEEAKRKAKENLALFKSFDSYQTRNSNCIVM